MLFSGSYKKEDVQFLLNIKKDISFLSIQEKEKMIQEGHNYGTLLNKEERPTTKYTDIYEKMKEQDNSQFLYDLYKMIQNIIKQRQTSKEIILVSLARAGTPIGILVKNILEKTQSKKCIHYSISIIKDFGLDKIALNYICQNHNYQDIVFIDGWVSKGSVLNELQNSLMNYQYPIKSELFVVNDLTGNVSNSINDYLIPNALLNSTISGLISRTIYEKNTFHSCYFYEEYKDIDKSQEFIDLMLKQYFSLNFENKSLQEINGISIIKERTRYINQIKKENKNFKVGINETTRVALRREPEEIILKDFKDINTLHLIQLSIDNGFLITENKNLPFAAVGIIKSKKKEQQ